MHLNLSHLALLPLVAGHTTFTNLYVNGVNQGDGVCVRMNRDPETASFPIEPVTDKAMACGYDGEKAVSRVCPTKGDDLLTFEFREYADGSQPGSIEDSHKGPCAVYMKRVNDATADNNAAGDGWFKIWQLDYDTSDGKWCTEKLIDNNGLISVHVPPDLHPGYYLVRPELLALHASADSPPDPQFYVGCAQVFVQQGGTAEPRGVHIGEHTYDLDMPALTYNIYQEPLALPYPMFGPEVYRTKGNQRRRDANKLVQDKGRRPDGCILVRDNWCGFEVPSYNDENGCWAKCWDQSDVCWNTALPTGNAACNIWQDKCTNIDDSCRSGDWHGPPNQGKDLTPVPKGPAGSLDVFEQ
ncbi:hypothetical protein EYZ11_006415 [Aspergillus tanneri]|uniref:AA9 family lytic polysaccharide monooxygenase n=1 Tax=Aspergillus tanneri TaxID=1220188 RepID=A0A4S3JFJ5_9EURO|nr:hypothetical protein EYZ11_006415 [Aspergillus tanneri]